MRKNAIILLGVEELAGKSGSVFGESSWVIGEPGLVVGDLKLETKQRVKKSRQFPTAMKKLQMS